MSIENSATFQELRDCHIQNLFRSIHMGREYIFSVASSRIQATADTSFSMIIDDDNDFSSISHSYKIRHIAKTFGESPAFCTTTVCVPKRHVYVDV